MVSQGVTKRSGEAAKHKKRNFSEIYTIVSKKTQVCQPFFLQTLHTSNCMVHAALSKVSAGCPVKINEVAEGVSTRFKKNLRRMLRSGYLEFQQMFYAINESWCSTIVEYIQAPIIRATVIVGWVERMGEVFKRSDHVSGNTS
ncbi:hypothetical protein PR048_010369 [Dryococelus australis]|uniref:Uncharacterized protein n=1 Tax=Dryococelus australis TaxID=614101 RepID=A0ABQ9I3P1_9NEOP|nr:hypothetical protein PR048_010369 [Dryococelus australis]